MNPYTIDVIALVILGGAFTVYAVWAFIRMDRVLRDPDHPDHEDAKAAVKMAHREAERDRWRL